MSLFNEVANHPLTVRADLSEFLSGTNEDGSYNGVNAMNVVYERTDMAGKHGVFTLKLADNGGMRYMDVKLKTYDGEWIESGIEELTIAIDGSWELWDLIRACKMIVTTEELHGKLA